MNKLYSDIDFPNGVIVSVSADIHVSNDWEAYGDTCVKRPTDYEIYFKIESAMSDEGVNIECNLYNLGEVVNMECSEASDYIIDGIMEEHYE